MAATFLFDGCATDKNSGPNAAAESNEKNPELGMSREQVLALYGPTNNMRVGNDGDTWVYHLNRDGGFIPWNYGYRPRTRIIEFGADGKVKRWSYSN